MPNNRTHLYWPRPVTLLACLFAAVQALGFAELRVYRPSGAPSDPGDYTFSTPKTSEIEGGAAFSNAGANKSSGGVAILAGAYAGGANAWAAQRVVFDVPEPCHVYATVKMAFTGDAFTYGYASWAGTSWRWAVHKNGAPARWHDRDIEAAFTVETVTEKIKDIVDLAGLGLGGPITLPQTAIELIEFVSDIAQEILGYTELFLELDNLSKGGDAAYVEETIHFTVPAGNHEFLVGLNGTCSALLTGFGCTLLRGQVEEIRLGLNSQEGLQPDLVVSGIVVENEAELRTHGPVDIYVERSNIGNAATGLETYELVLLPTDGSPFVRLKQAGRSGGPCCLHILPAYETVEEKVHYSGFEKKGTYDLLATVDPEWLVAELDENNNHRFKRIQVRGRPPNQPLEPNYGYPLELQRNHTFTFNTTTTDADGDSPYYYRYEILPPGSSAWLVLTNTSASFTNGWSGSSQLSITPVLTDPDLLPPAIAGVNTNTFVTLGEDQYRIRVMAADEDGISAASTEKVLTVTRNTLPSKPTVTGDPFGDTMKGISITATSSDAERDPVAFRFDWGDQYPPTWTDWMWCDPGSSSLTVSHLYSSPVHCQVRVEATDLYSVRYTSPVGHSAATSRTVDISPYWAPADSLTVMTVDQGRNTRLPNVGFTITGATNTTTATGGTGFWQAGVNPGSFTVTFADVAGYVTPPQQTRVLPHRGTVEFVGQYAHQTGTIQVNCNIPGLGTLSGHGTATGDEHAFTGTTWSTSGAWAGRHAIAFENPDPTIYGLPDPRRATNTLAANGTTVFSGRYIRRPLVSVALSYPTNSYLPPGAFALANEDAVEIDASGSYSPEQPTGGGRFPPLTLTNTKYRFEFDDTHPYEEDDAEGARDGLFDGRTWHVFHESGTRQVAVTVFDSTGCASVTTNVSVWIKERPKAQAIIDPTPAIAGEVITFTAEGSDGDAGDFIIGYEWTSPLTGLLATGRTFTTSSLPLGHHEISLRVQGSDLVWSEPEIVELEVLLPKDWPAFKRDPLRHANQSPYPERLYGQLPYGTAPGAWPYFADSAIEGSPVAANLDGIWTDGLEVVFVSRLGTLQILDSLGSLIWSANVGASAATPAIGDLNGDGQPDIVVGSQSGMQAFNRNGTSLFPPVGGNSFEYSMPLIADVDLQSPGREVVVTADDGSVHLIAGDGTGEPGSWPFSYGGPFPANLMFPSAPAVAELDTNHVGREIVVGGKDGTLYVLNAGGTSIAAFPVPGGAPIHTTPAVADLVPLAPGAEIVFGADDGVCRCLNYTPGGLLTQVWQYAVSPVAMIRSSPAIGLVGEAERSQVVFGCNNGTVYVLNGTNGVPALSYTIASGAAILSTPVIADIDTVSLVPPSQPEVIFGATDGVLYAVDFGRGGTLLWSIPLSAMPLHSSPALVDIDHDPDLEILIGANDNGLYALKATADQTLVPTVDFAASPTAGGRPLTVTFTNLTVNPSPALVFWRWDFGDEDTSMEQHPIHAYETPGTFTVGLTARTAHGPAQVVKANLITVAANPQADFSAGPLFGDVPLTVGFTNQSRFDAGTWLWNFGDSGASALENPWHRYDQPGTYTVRLQVSNDDGQDTLVRTNLITVRALPPVADFSPDAILGCTPLTVNFTDLSGFSPTAWLWDFGDGSTSATQHPAHTYAEAGRYLVSLTVSNAAGSDGLTSSTPLTVMQATLPEWQPALFLPFDEGSGTVTFDATTNANDGVLEGATWAEGFAGTALAFGGGGQFVNGDAVSVPHSPSLEPGVPFRVSARIKARGTDAYLAIVDKYEHLGGDAANGWTLYLNQGKLRFSVYAGSLQAGIIGTTDLRDDLWHTVAAECDGTRLRLFVDDALDQEVPSDLVPGPNFQPLGIGKRLSGWGGYMPFLGSMDEVALSRWGAAPEPVLSVIRSGQRLWILWSDCGWLQSAPDPEGPWTEVTNWTNPHEVQPSQPRAFYRLYVP